jgi:hypothetical protein
MYSTAHFLSLSYNIDYSSVSCKSSRLPLGAALSVLFFFFFDPLKMSGKKDSNRIAFFVTVFL